MNIEELRELCMALPGVTEDIKWGADLCFLIGDKMFCATSVDPPHAVSFKVKDEEFGELTATAGVIPAPYLARYKWVQVQEWSILNDADWDTYVKQSYELIKAKLPKSKQKALQ
ncbi:MmcQ/YjbR family DNA-binding protein [Pontibacter sp. H249]|uniref:MmcQ/YjbR family DNA-binding protein n=1 Tax=Pontibacter sp. H249 TaxID=3133420 RepID=UPI0030C3E735